MRLTEPRWINSHAQCPKNVGTIGTSPANAMPQPRIPLRYKPMANIAAPRTIRKIRPRGLFICETNLSIFLAFIFTSLRSWRTQTAQANADSPCPRQERRVRARVLHSCLLAQIVTHLSELPRFCVFTWFTLESNSFASTPDLRVPDYGSDTSTFPGNLQSASTV